VILGAGGAGRDILDVVEAINRHAPAYDFLGFLDDGPVDEARLLRRGAILLGPFAALGGLSAHFVIGIGSGGLRRQIDQYASGLGLDAAVLVHPQATMGADLVVGPGLVAAAGARVTSNVRLGRHVHLNLNATVAHDCTLGDYVTVSPGANVSGGVVLEDEVLVGTGSSINQGLTIGRGTTVGAGAAVVDDLAGGVTAVGIPARVRGEQ